MALSKRKIAYGVALVGVCLMVVVGRAVVEGRAALDRGDEAATQGDMDVAMVQWRRATRWYVPLAPHVERGYERLETYARASERAGDTGAALTAWREVRRSVHATRSLWRPHEERLARANQHIAELMAVTDPGAGATEAERVAFHKKLLDRSLAPSNAWALFAILGLVMWLGGAVYFARRGVTDDDRISPRPAAFSAGLVLVGLVVWLTGLAMA